jgi:hypothetical protein
MLEDYNGSTPVASGCVAETRYNKLQRFGRLGYRRKAGLNRDISNELICVKPRALTPEASCADHRHPRSHGELEHSAPVEH